MLSRFVIVTRSFIVLIVTACVVSADDRDRSGTYQYYFRSIAVPAASASEPTLPEVSVRKAVDYVEQAAVAWTKDRECISCHTNGSYLVIRSALTPYLGPPNPAIRDFVVAELRELAATPREELERGTKPAEVIYAAAGLAAWDTHVGKEVSPETQDALDLMFSLQQSTGEWASVDCWPPFESSAYQLATVAAMTVGSVPGWKDTPHGKKFRQNIESLQSYLRHETPPQDYDRTDLLWASASWAGLLDKTQKQEIIETLWRHQQSDGGWSIRTFSTPEGWGRGNRAKKLRSEPDFENPPSDGHQTGLAMIALRLAGVPSDDPRIQRGVRWLQKNQRASGRWWTRSLNTDKWHFITYTGTLYPLYALALCDALPDAQLARSPALPAEGF